MSNVNPDIRKVFVGKKSLEEYDVYPLSIGDQRKVSSILLAAYKSFRSKVSSVSEEEQEEVVNAVVESIYEDIPKVLALVFDVEQEKAVEIFDKMTNSQLSELIDHVWEVNYKSLEKNGSGLFRMLKNLFMSSETEQAIPKKPRSLRKK